MSVFRCYMTGSDGHFRDVVSLEAASDREALTLARALPVAQAGFELWNGSRLVCSEPRIDDAPRTDAPIKERDPMQGTGAAVLQTVRPRLEQLAASIAETFWAARSLTVTKSKEKQSTRD